MNLLETLLNAQGGGLVREMAKNLGMGEGDAKKGIGQLAPALARGLSRNAKQPGGLEALMGAISGGKHDRYLDNPELLGRKESIQDGNSILGHIFGSKDVSRNVAGHAAKETGLSSGLLKKMLPMVAAAAMGSMGKQASGGGLLSQLTGGGGGGGLLGSLMGGGGQSKPDAGMAGMLEGFLDSDKDGAVVDDLLSMAKKFF